MRRKDIRAIVKQVHPDLFYNRPSERQQNCHSLQILHNYIDNLHEGRPLSKSILLFFVKHEGSVRRVEATLPVWGSLEPLFLAFGVAPHEPFQPLWGADIENREDGGELLAYLQSAMRQALHAAEAYEALQKRVKELRLTIEQDFGLASLQLSNKIPTTLTEQRQEVESLEVLEACLRSLRDTGGPDFSGLNICICHPESSPIETYGYEENAKGPKMHGWQGYIGQDGVVHLVAEEETIMEALLLLDLQQAKVLSDVTSFWLQRSRTLLPVLQRFMRVKDVWADTRTEWSAQKAVLWAGYFLQQRDTTNAALNNQEFAFSVLLHSDENSPMLDYSEKSSVLQVRTDCPAEKVMNFLSSEAGISAHQMAEVLRTSDEEEQELFAEIKVVFQAKDVVRVCSMYEQGKVMKGARRLLEHADTIKQSIDLTGVSIAIDDCYDVWGPGFISIPYDFLVGELKPQLSKLLTSGTGRLDRTQVTLPRLQAALGSPRAKVAKLTWPVSRSFARATPLQRIICNNKHLSGRALCRRRLFLSQYQPLLST